MRIVFVINTDCLDYDERVRKEAVTLLALGHEIQIIAMENENLNVSGITHYGIPYTSISIITRKLFRQAQHIYIKAFEMHVKFILQLLKTNWDVLWVHEHSSAGILFYGWFIKVLKKDKKLVWNQHELALDSWIDSRIYRWIINKCDAVIHANQERASYLGRKYQEISPKLQYVINNYPSDSFISEPKHVQSEKLIAW